MSLKRDRIDISFVFCLHCASLTVHNTASAIVTCSKSPQLKGQVSTVEKNKARADQLLVFSQIRLTINPTASQASWVLISADPTKPTNSVPKSNPRADLAGSVVMQSSLLSMCLGPCYDQGSHYMTFRRISEEVLLDAGRSSCIPLKSRCPSETLRLLRKNLCSTVVSKKCEACRVKI